MNILSPFRFIGAMIRMAWWKICGYQTLIGPGEQITRLEICGNCVFLDPDLGECTICGCDVDAKTILASERCPKNKWLRIKRKKRTV